MEEQRGTGDDELVPPDGAVGAVVAGVRLTAWLGGGASGTVWAGTDVATGERVAVKLLRPDVVGSRETWLREAGLLQRLDLPHLLALRRACTDPPALVTELAAGGSLAAQVRARGPLSAGEAVTVLVPLAETLAGLHRQRVVHGDVSGGNILFVDLGRPVLADLGAATASGRHGLRRAPAAPGASGAADVPRAAATPGYAAPEVLAGAAAREPADVHGLGAVAWLALTGSPPPPAADRLPLRLLAPECPDALVEVVQDALRADPARRPSAAEVARRVRASGPAAPVHLVPAAARGLRDDEALTYRVEGWPARPERARGRAAAVRARVAGAVRAAGALRGRGGKVVLGTAAVLLATAGAAGVLAGVLPRAAGGDPAPGASTTVVSHPVGPLHERVVDLVGRREAALRSGDPDAVAGVHAPGTAYAGADVRLLAQGPLDVSFEVASVVPVAGTSDVADVDVVTRWGSGREVRERVRVRLVPAAGSWVLQDVRLLAAG